jgi:pimeloyl-ACP methyl ester carboxylesterase
MVDDALAQVRNRGVRYTYVSGNAIEPSYAGWLTDQLADAEIVSWPDSSHFPHLAHPDAFANILTLTAAW